jgi:hypothetical protein
MAISREARRNHDALFLDHKSAPRETDPELVEIFDNSAFGKIFREISPGMFRGLFSGRTGPCGSPVRAPSEPSGFEIGPSFEVREEGGLHRTPAEPFLGEPARGRAVDSCEGSKPAEMNGCIVA